MNKKIIYKKGTKVMVNVHGDTRAATIVKDVYSMEDKIRVQINDFPIPISIKHSQLMD